MLRPDVTRPSLPQMMQPYLPLLSGKTLGGKNTSGKKQYHLRSRIFWFLKLPKLSQEGRRLQRKFLPLVWLLHRVFESVKRNHSGLQNMAHRHFKPGPFRRVTVGRAVGRTVGGALGRPQRSRGARSWVRLWTSLWLRLSLTFWLWLPDRTEPLKPEDATSE